MKKIVLVSCVSKKNRGTHKAKDLYASPLFRKAYEYAESLNPDKISSFLQSIIFLTLRRLWKIIIRR